MGFAQDTAEAAPAVDNAFIFNTLLFLIGGFLVFWMAAGFAMLEAGLVRSKNVTMQLTKNIALFSIAAIMYWLVGYNLMYPGDGWSDAGHAWPDLRNRVISAAIPRWKPAMRPAPTSSSS